MFKDYTADTILERTTLNWNKQESKRSHTNLFKVGTMNTELNKI